MEARRVVDDNGRELEIEDVNEIAFSAALADDHVFAELLRMRPNGTTNPPRGILPFAAETRTLSGGITAVNEATCSPDTITARGVIVAPFRAFIGSRTAFATSADESWRDIRSCLAVTGHTTLEQVVALSANASGNPRWDLIYAAVTVDGEIEDDRFSKDTGDPDAVPVESTFVVAVNTGLVLLVAVGTPGASPAYPALPADAAGVYNVPLAYVRVANGAVAFSHDDILDASSMAPATTLVQSRAMGTVSARPASSVANKAGILLATRMPWAASGHRPGPYIPSSMVGGEEIFVGFQLATSLTKSHLSGDVVDTDRDWRRRIFSIDLQALSGSTNLLAYDPNLASTAAGVPMSTAGGWGVNTNRVMSNSMGLATGVTGGTDYLIADITSTLMSVMGATVRLWVSATTGELFITYSGTPNVQLFAWIRATAPFGNL